VTLLLFLLAEMMPGDAVTAMVTPDAPTSREALEQMRATLGLDKPWPVRYFVWLGQLLHGNMGYSYIDFQPIAKTIVSRLPATLELILGFVGQSIPVFFMGLAVIYVFSLRLAWLPVSGMATPGAPLSIVDNLRHLVLPMLSLSIFRITVFMRYTRSSFLEVLQNEYLLVAKAKGVSERRLVLHHAARNALIPIITVIGLNVPVLFAGAVIIETVFQWPGIGLLYITAVGQRNHPLIMGLALMSALVVFASNFVVDVTYSFVDPRIRYD
jgi:peptide/nickel transport system permease protein